MDGSSSGGVGGVGGRSDGVGCSCWPCRAGLVESIPVAIFSMCTMCYSNASQLVSNTERVDMIVSASI